MRCAIVLDKGFYPDPHLRDKNDEEPRLEFLEIAKIVNADILSYTTASLKRGFIFRKIFGRYKKIGSALNAAILASNYDRLYITSEGVGLPLIIMLKALRWKGQVICVFHNMSWRSKKYVVSSIGHSIFAALITVNKAQAHILVEECGMPKDKVISVFNWVDDKFFRPSSLSDASSNSSFMSCGAENRDYDTLARAARRIQGSFVVYGHGYLTSNIKAQAEAPNLTYMPRVSYTELRKAYTSSAIVIVPLNDVDYAAGVTGLVEAMASGQPIIVTASRGIAEYISFFDPETIVGPGDDEALAAAIKRLSTNAILRVELGIRNRAFAIENCSVDKYSALIRDILLLK